MRYAQQLAKLFVLLWLLASLPGCGVRGGNKAENQLVIVTETPVIAEFAREVAGDRATVHALIPPGQDPHTYQLTAADLRLLAEADLVLLNGGTLAPSVEQAVKTQVDPARVVVVSAGLEPLPAARENGEQVDPHFWLSVPNAISYVKTIRDTLVSADPEGASPYNQNAERLIKRLEELDAWVREQVSSIPPERRLLVTGHRVFTYFAREYGFTVVGTLVPSASTEAEPSAADLRRLIERIREKRVPAIFVERGFNPTLARQVAEATGAKVVEGLTDQPDPSRPEVATYEAMMRHNVMLLVEELR